MVVRANEIRSILRMICHKKHKWLGHIILRHEGFFRDIIEGKMVGNQGKPTRGRKRKEFCTIQWKEEEEWFILYCSQRLD